MRFLAIAVFLIPLSVHSQPQKLPPPVIDDGWPGPISFPLVVRIYHIVPGGIIYYQLNDEPFQIYTPHDIIINETTTIQAYAIKDGWINSDTVSETYTKLYGYSQLTLKRLDGNPITYLTEIDNTFVLEIVTPHTSLSSISTSCITINGGDSETFTISNPITTAQALVFTDTITFRMGAVTAGDDTLQIPYYDTIIVSWTNPGDPSDVVSGSIVVRAAPKMSAIYFTDAAGNALTGLTGEESEVYVVVVDQVFDPNRASEYKVTVQNILGPGHIGEPDLETYILAPTAIPGRYRARIPLVLSAATQGNGILEARIGDQLRAGYTDPVDGDQANAQIGLGVPVERAGILGFTNPDFTTPLEVTPEGYWDAGKGFVYLMYTDDSIDVTTPKSIALAVRCTTGTGDVLTDAETFTMANATQPAGGAGAWLIAIALSENPAPVPGNGALEFYFRGIISASVFSHRNATVEMLDGGVSAAELPVIDNALKVTDTEVSVIGWIRYAIGPGKSVTMFFNPSATCKSLYIYNLNGELVKEFQGINGNSVTWNADGRVNGVYYIKAVVDGKASLRKVVL